MGARTESSQSWVQLCGENNSCFPRASCCGEPLYLKGLARAMGIEPTTYSLGRVSSLLKTLRFPRLWQPFGIGGSYVELCETNSPFRCPDCVATSCIAQARSLSGPILTCQSELRTSQIDPTPTSAGPKSRSAAVSCRIVACYRLGLRVGRGRQRPRLDSERFRSVPRTPPGVADHDWRHHTNQRRGEEVPMFGIRRREFITLLGPQRPDGRLPRTLSSRRCR